ncbi:MAG: hypothetical protein COT24_01250 [Candidatus Kerfeldbacteria bacterium CG08_land_8_20_14_0_20_40_16]|uniref:RNA polymerase subunit sigma-24 n=1 Tax=Candidatus Kerfeldbacteria bacterium CG08_land_8_20_14_0_20_40_16 TaxID=2014244 RepID=A0A2H0YWL3_9BACT|nr:MAG: hypothetical protein COT24_01250 [Candidatus Kerfeldbacteria bacterium CG08_land_8_20_14_0_20_40_16]
MTTYRDCEERTDEELVKLTLADQEWYLCLMRRYESKLSRYIRRISGLNEQDLEDVLQDIFIKAYRNLNAFDPDLKFNSWIYRIAHNEAISRYRKLKTRPQLVKGEEGEKMLALIEDKGNPEEKLDNKISREKIQGILAQMDLKYREVLTLKYLEEKDYKEISDIVKKPMGTVGTLINRAKKQFRAIANEQRTEF